MLISIMRQSYGGDRPLTVQCPGCRQLGTFMPVDGIQDLGYAQKFKGADLPEGFLGHRICPNPSCRTHIFVAYDWDGNLHKTYPAQGFKFDPTGIPSAIANTFEEALACSAEELHVAAAIMVRRTLEELCADKGAKGKDLHARIGALRSSVVLPAELFDGLDALRLLGNDAAHLEAKTYESIGKEELDVAIEITKEILKAVYQLDGLVGRLRSLQRPSA